MNDAPATKPRLLVSPRGRIRIGDEATPTRRAKPAGVLGALIFTKIAAPGEAPPAHLKEAEFEGLATRTHHQLEIPAGSNGRTLYVMAQWISETGLRGPISTVAATTIAA